jgi:hypothetical protein
LTSSFFQVACIYINTSSIPLVSIENAHHPYQRFPELLIIDLTDRFIYKILDRINYGRPFEATDTLVGGVVKVDHNQVIIRYLWKEQPGL